jgi:hypothetical protein
MCRFYDHIEEQKTAVSEYLDKTFGRWHFSLEGILTKILVLDKYKALSIHKIRQKYRHYTRHYT